MDKNFLYYAFTKKIEDKNICIFIEECIFQRMQNELLRSLKLFRLSRCRQCQLHGGICFSCNSVRCKKDSLKIIDCSQINEEMLLFKILTDIEEYIIETFKMIVFHGGALSRGDDILFLIGQSGAGKTTLTYHLVNHGWDLLDDDCIYWGSNCVLGWGFPLRGRTNLSLAKNVFANTFDPGQNERVLIDVLNCKEKAYGYISIIFPEYSEGGGFYCETVSNMELFTRLLQNLRFSVNDANSLRMITHLIRTIKGAYQVRYNTSCMVEKILEEVLI